MWKSFSLIWFWYNFGLKFFSDRPPPVHAQKAFWGMITDFCNNRQSNACVRIFGYGRGKLFTSSKNLFMTFKRMAIFFCRFFWSSNIIRPQMCSRTCPEMGAESSNNYFGGGNAKFVDTSPQMCRIRLKRLEFFPRQTHILSHVKYSVLSRPKSWNVTLKPCTAVTTGYD